MLKIGELAKLCNVSAQTLRYYDCEGILSPEEVDKFSGYRYYSARQVETLHQILKYKSLGFELSEIKKLLQANGDKKVDIFQKKINSLKNEVSTKHDSISELKHLCKGLPPAKDIRRISLANRF